MALKNRIQKLELSRPTGLPMPVIFRRIVSPGNLSGKIGYVNDIANKIKMKRNNGETEAKFLARYYGRVQSHGA